MAIEGWPITSVGIDDPDFSGSGSVMCDESGKRCACVAVVQEVTADDQVVLALNVPGRQAVFPCRRRGAPETVSIFHWRQIVQAQILPEKAFRQRMAIARGDIGTPTMTDEAREGEPAADFQNSLPGAYEPERHARRQVRARGPQHAEQWPLRRRNAHTLCFPERIEELLTIEERANDQIVDARNGDALLLGLIACQ
jgi:hypothetical protein